MKFEFGELNVVCSSIERSRRFYEDVLGFAEVEWEDGALRLSLGDRYLLLLPASGAETPAQERAAYMSVPVVSFDLTTPDLEGAKRYLSAHGVAVGDDFEAGTAGGFQIEDPDGLVIEIVGR